MLIITDSHVVLFMLSSSQSLHYVVVFDQRPPEW